MIKALDPKFNSLYKSRENHKVDKKNSNSASFGSGMNVLTVALQACEQHPMLGVTAIDATTCIVPRAAVDFNTNAHAGLETFRRESSGLFVNCLLPSFFVYGIANVLKPFLLPKEYRHLDMASSWADESSLEKLSGYFPKSGTREERVSKYVKNVLSNLEGFNSSSDTKWMKYSSSQGYDDAVKSMTDAILNNSDKKQTKQVLKSVYSSLVKDVNATEHIRFVGDKLPFESGLSALLRDTIDCGRKFSDKAVIDNVEKFTKSAIKFVNHKSIAGMAVVLPLAMSMQSINRWITRKQSGVSGAPIYRDFGKDENKPNKKDNNLFLYKAIGATSILGLAALSMMKLPSMKMFQFKGWFPTLNQARWIAAATFASRVVAAEDKNEVRESTIRDAAGFASLYFLGDFVAKALASGMNKINPKIDLINKYQDVDKKASVFTKFKNWMKNHQLKSFDEVSSNMKNYRSACQATSLAVSMLLLGLFIPIWNRKQTEKNRAKELDNLQSPLANGPESTASVLWHNWTSDKKAFCGFEKMTSFK